MDDAERDALYRRVLAAGVHTSPGVRAPVGEGQEVEVAHVVADALQTLVFYRLHGGPDLTTLHFSPVVVPVDPPELRYGGGSETRSAGFYVAKFPPVLPYRRTITLGFGPAYPDSADSGALGVARRRTHQRPSAVVTVPIDPATVYRSVRTAAGGVLRVPGGPDIQVVSVAAGLTGLHVALWTAEPGLDLFGHGHMLDHLEDPPPGAPPALWRRAMGRPARSAVGLRPVIPPPRTRRVLLRRSWQAATLPDGVPLTWEGASSQGSGFVTGSITYGPPPAEAAGVVLRYRCGYRWEPLAVLADVPAPAPVAVVPLNGHALTWGEGRLELLAWEPNGSQFQLVARPEPGFEPPDWPGWLPELRLIVSNGSVGLLLSVCDDGVLLFTVPQNHVAVEGASVQLGLRAVGRRLPVSELELWFDGGAAGS